MPVWKVRKAIPVWSWWPVLFAYLIIDICASFNLYGLIYLFDLCLCQQQFTMSSHFIFTKRSLIGQLFLYAWANLFSVLQSFMAQSELNNTVEQCCFVYTSYQKTLTQLRSCLRGLSYDRDIFEWCGCFRQYSNRSMSTNQSPWKSVQYKIHPQISSCVMRP